MKKITDFYTKKSGPAQSRPEQSASNEGIQEESSCSAPANKLPKLSISDDQAGVSEIEALPDEVFLGNELRRWQSMWQSAEKELPSNLLLALGACDVDAFPNIHRLLLVACTLPISSAEAERSFSLTKRIKSCTRSTMSEERFSDLAVIAMHYPERFEVDKICEAFVKAHSRRLFQAKLFG
ncbi:52 kDa repressor of the inhibitor of the protein kinase-like [Montipora capricornis]|uniref:52 kDa repressor of the inhibitor of the protein kinase-like n=1 Tax=Montipora capricornis TaxID=246305 RepID=UPI0035F1AED2